MATQYNNLLWQRNTTTYYGNAIQQLNIQQLIMATQYNNLIYTQLNIYTT
jgi:hypothetical protein